ncbi:FIG00761799: membrane protein [Alloactinosynnema sp. L-07]|uniref:M50 family metallopeptidase n=1 Tax=Alloactinosynnema sp. L-07 TaxID=1653480 RepID=UPI00065F03B3|nr:M50 family metallopeptidase [Alloactinosynnema sp. L-07]CRK62157.1 FIG00761799: membrane protein [Alloactinosynnema sp. L-07]
MQSVPDLWQQLFGDQSRPPEPVILVTLAVAAVVVVVNALWRPARNVITIVHEAGHALVAVLVGRRLSGIRLHSDTSGVTVSRGRPDGPGMVCTALAGYVAPSLLGLGFAAFLQTERVSALLMSCAVLLFGVLIMIRNLYGALTLIATGAVLFAVSWFATDTVQAAFAYLITWFLLLGGLRPVGELQTKRRRGQARDSDADQLARLTGAPGFFWVGSFGLVNLGALVIAAGWLLLG